MTTNDTTTNTYISFLKYRQATGLLLCRLQKYNFHITVIHMHAFHTIRHKQSKFMIPTFYMYASIWI